MVNIGELIRLLVAISPAGTSEEADIFRELLLEIHADAAAALIVPYRRDVGGPSGYGGKQDCVLKTAHAPAGEETGNGHLARLAKNVIAPLDFAEPLELSEARIQRCCVRSDRQVEHAAAEGPWARIPLDGATDRIAPRISGVVERSGINQRPVHEVATRVMGVFVGVKNVDHAHFSDRDYQPIGRLLSGELVKSRADILAVTTEVDCLTEERALKARVGIARSDLVGLSTQEAGRADRGTQPKALIDFRVHPNFGALPEPHARVQRDVGSLTALIRDETVGAEKRISE